MSTHEIKKPSKVTLHVEKGEEGLWYVTSPEPRGLLIAGDTMHNALLQVQKALDDMATASEPDPAWMVEVAREAGGTGLEANGFRGAADEARIGNSDKKAPVLAAITALRLAISRGHVVLAPVMPSEEEMLRDARKDTAQMYRDRSMLVMAEEVLSGVRDDGIGVSAALQARRNVYASLGAVKAVSSGPVVPEVDLREVATSAWDAGWRSVEYALEAIRDGGTSRSQEDVRSHDVSRLLSSLPTREA